MGCRPRVPGGNRVTAHQLDKGSAERYKDAAGGWRWRRQSPNGKIVGASTEAYESEADAIANYWVVCGDNAPMLRRRAEG